MLLRLPGSHVSSGVPEPPSVWRTLHVSVIATLWVLLWVVVTLVEHAPTLHDVRVPIWQPIASLLVPTTVVTAWITWQLKSTQFDRPGLHPPNQWFAHHLRRLPLFLIVMIGGVFALRWFVFRMAGAYHGYSLQPLHLFLVWEIFKCSLLYSLWLGLIFGTLTLARWREDNERMLGMQKALAEAQLAQLQAQLRPHFIFNALNTVSSLMHTDVARADRVLAQLGDLLRASLRANRREEVSLREELELLERYAEIMRERFDGRVSFEWKVAQETLDAQVPSMLLQPLLENAFKHGIERSSAPERIIIRTSRVGDELHIDIHNSGPRLTNRSGGVGLQNCRERLYLLYESAAELTVANAEESGVLARVRLPWRPAAG